MKTHFASLGLTDTRFVSVEATELDSGYLLAKVRWEMTVRISDGTVRHFDAFATYVLQRNAEKLCIVDQLDHQDLAAVIDSHRETGSA